MTTLVYVVRNRTSGEIFNIYASKEGASAWIREWEGRLGRYYIDKWDLKP